MILNLSNEKLSVKKDTYGAELVSAVGTDGHEYIWTGEAWRGHAPVLFPICGRILNGKYTAGGKEYEMLSHGFAKRSEFAVDEATERRISLSLSSNDATRAIYPFDFKLCADFTLDGDRLTVAFRVKNIGNTVLPYMLGWHPGFVLGGDGDIGGFTLELGDCAPVMHPLANGPFLSDIELPFPLDNCKYALCEKQIYDNDTLILTGTGGRCLLSGEGDGHTVELTYTDNLPYFCIWKAPDSNARFICLEPWSDVPSDGITPENFDTRKMSRLGAGDSAKYVYTVKFGNK